MTKEEKMKNWIEAEEAEMARVLAGPPEGWDSYQPRPFPSDDAEAFGVGFYSNLRELHEKETVAADDLMIGVRRRQVTIFASVTNVGKTTVMLNHALAAAGGQAWLPLLPYVPEKPLKVVFIDGESTDDELKKDTRRMLDRIGFAEVALDNFIPVVDGQIDGEPLDLTKQKHFTHIKRFVEYHKPDILIIDTITSLFSIYNENDNAEIVRKVIRPLKALAIAGDCAVWASHHIGKAGESEQTEGAYKGRGASAFGANVRGVITLQKEKSLGDGYVKLSLEKSKGCKMEPVNLKLDFAGRTFDLAGPLPVTTTPYEQLIGIFNGQPLKTKDIKSALSSMPERTLERLLKEAVEHGDLTQVTKGSYRLRIAQSCKEPANPDDSLASANPIGSGGLADHGQSADSKQDRLDFQTESENGLGGSLDCTILQDESAFNWDGPIGDVEDDALKGDEK